MKQFHSRFLGALVWAFLWALVPFLFIFWARDLALEESLDEERRRSIAALEEYGRLFPGISPIEKLLYVGLIPAESALDHDDRDSQRIFAEQTKRMKTLFPGVFEFAYFDSSSQLVASLSDLPEYRQELSVLGLHSHSSWKRTESSKIELDRLRIILFGPISWSHPTQRKVLRAFSGPKRMFVGFSKRLQSRAWFYVWISLPCDLETIAYRSLLAFHRPIDPDQKQEIIDLTADLDPQEAAFGGFAPAFRGALEKLGSNFFQAIAHDGTLWVQVSVSPKKRLLICAPDRTAERGARRMSAQRGSMAAFFLLGVGVLGGVGSLLPPLSLRRKLLILFVSAVIVPLCPFVFSVWRLQIEERRVLEERELQNQEEIQREYFRGSLDLLSLIEVAAERVFGEHLPLAYAEAERQVGARVQRFRNRFPAECVGVFDTSGQCVSNYSRGYKDLFQRSIPFIGLKVARTVAEYNGQDPAPQIVAKEQALKASLETFGMDLDQLMSVFDEVPNQIAQIAMDETTSAFLRFHLSDARRVVRFIVFLIWGDRLLYDVLPYKSRDRFQRMLPDHTLLAGSMITLGDATPPSSFTPFISEAYYQSKLGLAWNVVRPVHQVEQVDDGRWLLSFARGGLGNRITSVLVSSDARIRKALGEKAFQMGLMMIPLLLLGVVMGTWMGRSFLQPFQRLSEGMEAVDRHRFDHRVPVVGEDELARLAQTFNLMMEGLEDLEVGKVVQATFFPDGALEAGGWSVFGSSRSAAKVGGDYFDYLALPDGRWLIVIGDATGHGVSAGLIVAMAKAVSHHPLAEKTPSAILNRLNNVLAPTLKRRWMMTCFIGLFDPATGSFEASNAGQNYPWLVRNGLPEPIAIDHFMLGAKPNLDFRGRTMALSGADWICFYTDGLTESIGHDGKIIGPERFRQALPDLQRSSARETHQAILEWHAQMACDQVLQDDLTVVVLQTGSRLETTSGDG